MVSKKDIFHISNYDYKIPPRLIAQEPVSKRDESRLLVINRENSEIKQGIFKDILDFLRAGDAIVLNNTKVIKARLSARKETGANVEVLLVKQREKGIWEALVKPGKRAKLGDTLIFEKEGRVIRAKVLGRTEQGGRILAFSPCGIESFLDELGKVPLPPYIKKDIDDPDKYQTVYAKEKGAIAAPTAGFHFTKDLLAEIKKRGVKVIYVTLHCGLATFRPVKTEDIREHKIDPEWIEVSPFAAAAVNKTKQAGNRVIAVGTTSIRSLESAAYKDKAGRVYIRPFSGETNLYIFPGYKFNAADVVITNFHTPCSTNFILISSFCGIKLLRKAYALAIKKDFRFFSFGDATLIL